MVASDELTVEIRREGTRVAACLGPGEADACSAFPISAQLPCAGAELFLRSAPDDCWHFTVPAAARGCPLAWLASKAGSSTRRGFSSASGCRGERTLAFWQ